MPSRFEIFGVIICALVVAAGIGWWMVHFADQKQLIAVVAAKIDLVAPKMIGKDDLYTISVPREALPLNALTQADEIVGKVLTRSVTAREIITSRDLVYNRDPNSDSALVPPGKVGFVLPSSWLASPFPKVKKNDFVNVYVALPPARNSAPSGGIVLSMARVISVNSEKDGTPASVLLALDDNGVIRISQAHASSYQLTVVVESAEPAEATSTFK